MAIGISRETLLLLVVLLLREMRLWGLHLGDHPIAVGSSGGGGGDAGGADSAGSSGHHAGRAGRAPDTEVGLRGSIRSILLASLVVVVPVWNWSGRLHHLLNVPGTGCGLQQSVLLCRGDEVPDWDRSGRLHHLLSVPSIGCGLPKSILLSLVVGVPAWDWSGRLYHLLHLLNGREFVVRELELLLGPVLLAWSGCLRELRVLVAHRVHGC